MSQICTAIYQNVVVGDGEGNPADTVIPPYSTVSPVSGTVPSGQLMGLMPVATSQVSAEPMSYLVKFTKGHHGSVLTPAPAYGVTPADAAAAVRHRYGDAPAVHASMVRYK